MLSCFFWSFQKKVRSREVSHMDTDTWRPGVLWGLWGQWRKFLLGSPLQYLSGSLVFVERRGIKIRHGDGKGQAEHPRTLRKIRHFGRWHIATWWDGRSLFCPDPWFFFSVELLWVGATNGMVVKLELGKGSRCRVLQVILADLQGGLRGIFGYWVLFASGSSKTPGGWSGKSTRVAMNSFKCTSSSHGCSQHLHVIPLTRKKLLERKLLMWRSSTISRMKAKSSRLLGLTIFFERRPEDFSRFGKSFLCYFAGSSFKFLFRWPLPIVKTWSF